MIFYNSGLMQNLGQLRLFVVSNPKPFKRFEDHEAALQIQLHELIERAIFKKQNPVQLIEQYLETTYNGGSTVEDMANFLMLCPQMAHAMHSLKDNWAELDETLPEETILYGRTSRQEAIQTYSEITLVSYLDALSKVYEL